MRKLLETIWRWLTTHDERDLHVTGERVASE